MKFTHAIRVATLIVCLALPGFANASSSDPSGWVGALGGMTIPNADNTTSRLAFGITGGAKLGSEWGVGGYYLTSSKDESVGKFGYDLYGVEVSYFFEGEAAGVYLGGRLGTSKLTAGIAGTDTTTSPMNWGAVAGVNKFLGDNFSLGGEVNFFSIPESTSNAVTLKGFTMLNFLASAKFWF